MDRSMLVRRSVPPLLLTLTVLLLAVRAGQDLARMPGGQFRSDMVAGELIRGTVVGQTFVAEETGLYRVDVRLATNDRRNSGPIIFHLRQSPAATSDLATVQVDAAQVNDNAFHAFEFGPLPNARGETLYFYLEAPEARPGNAITVWANSQDMYTSGRAVALWPINDRIKDLAFRVYYRLSTRQALHEMLDRLAADKPGILGNTGWYVALGMVYLTLLFELGWALGIKPDAET